jgi:hypothetical protein
MLFGMPVAEKPQPSLRTQMSIEKRWAGQGATPGSVTGGRDDRLHSFGGLAFATSVFSRSPCALKARGQEILAGIILPPKDRALKRQPVWDCDQTGQD